MNLSVSKLKTIRSLHLRKYREKLGLTLVEGSRLVRSAIDGGVPISDLVVSTGYRGVEGDVEDPVRTLTASGCRVSTVDEEVFATLSDVETSQGVLAVVPVTWVEGEIVKGARKVLALDSVQDPGNAGAILRTAAWYGVDVVISGPGTVDLFSPKVLRASMGGIWGIQVARISELSGFLSDFRSSGGSLYAASMTGTDHGVWTPAAAAVLIFGNEGNGLSAAVRELGPESVTIHRIGQSAAVESLNVAVAAGILLDSWLGSNRRRD